MSSLLTSRSLYSADEYVVKSDKNNKTRFYKRPDKIDIPFSSWEEAFDTYTSVYVTTATSLKRAIKLAQDMLSYKHNIRSMYKSNHNWSGYDRHFRRLRELDNAPWNALRPDLHVQYCMNKTSKQNDYPSSSYSSYSYQPNQGQSGGNYKSLKTAEGFQVPYGYCAAFHSKFQRCDKGQECPYKHRCPKCNNRHPIHRMCSSGEQHQQKYRQPGPIRPKYSKNAENPSSHPTPFDIKPLDHSNGPNHPN